MVGPRFPVAETLGDLLIVNVHVCSDVLAEDKGAVLQVIILRNRVCHIGLQGSVKASSEDLALDLVQV